LIRIRTTIKRIGTKKLRYPLGLSPSSKRPGSSWYGLHIIIGGSNGEVYVNMTAAQNIAGIDCGLRM
jgi:hypothetical protein